MCGKDGVEVEEIGRVEGWGGVDKQEINFTLCVLLSFCPQKADHPDGIPECEADAMRFAVCLHTQQ